MKLKANLAQAIVNAAMERIPYNVNIMNEHGYIIASGNHDRINTLHVGALQAIEERKILPMDTSFGPHGQPGVNMPLFYGGEVIGVIGITGNPQTVTPLASLLQATAELLLRQSEINRQQNSHHDQLNRFLNQWIKIKADIMQRTTFVLEAQQLKINLNHQWCVLAIHCPPQFIRSIRINPKDFTLSPTISTSIVITYQSSTINHLIKICRTKQVPLGIGEPNINLGNSADQAYQALEIQQILHNPKLIYYKDIALISDLMKQNFHLKPLVDKFNQLSQTTFGKELITTICEYIRYNQSVKITADKMHIHRNTLNHRLLSIKKVFKLDPHNTLQLITLYIAYLQFMWRHEHDTK